MERVLLNKVRWLSAHGHEVVIVTTDQGRRAPFYEFPPEVRMIDLGIDYSVDNALPLARKITRYLRKRRLHRHRLTELLMRERPDITVSLYPSESSFIPAIKDGSKKVLELHFNRFFRLQYGRRGLIGLIDRFRSRRDVALARRFDSFVVLTEEDRRYWGDLKNIRVIPNAAMTTTDGVSDCSAMRVIAVGRLDYQKGFDRLLKIWAAVKQEHGLPQWHLDIFGQGEWRGKLERMASDLGVSDSVKIHTPVKNITEEYLGSSILAMTSRYEGFPMVMIEGMSAGLPVVSYGFKCGPKDIIRNGADGIVVNEDDVVAFADALAALMVDDEKRKAMGRRALEVTGRYSEEKVMGLWMQLFSSLLNRE